MKEIKVYGEYLVDKKNHIYGDGARIEIDGAPFSGDTKEIIVRALEPQPYVLRNIEITYDNDKYYCNIMLRAPDGEIKEFVFEYLHSNNGKEFLFTEKPNLTGWGPISLKKYFGTIETIIKRIENLIKKDEYVKKEFSYLFK